MLDNCIFITGASTGIGAALARHYASPGTRLCLLTNSDPDKLNEVAKSCEANGAIVRLFTANVRDKSLMHEIAGTIISEIGLPNLVIANAGIGPPDPDEYMESELPAETMAVNYLGVINTLSGFIEPMKTRGAGCLVAISSVSAMRSTPNSGIYSASKAAVNMWTEGLRFRLKPHGVNVITIFPGFVKTVMTENNPFYMPGMITTDVAARMIGRAIQKRRARYYLPLLARIIWRSFHYLPDPVYDLVMTLAKKYWPSRS